MRQPLMQMLFRINSPAPVPGVSFAVLLLRVVSAALQRARSLLPRAHGPDQRTVRRTVKDEKVYNRINIALSNHLWITIWLVEDYD